MSHNESLVIGVNEVLLDTLVSQTDSHKAFYIKSSQVDSSTVVCLVITHITTEGLMKSRLVLGAYPSSQLPKGLSDSPPTYEDNLRRLEDINEILLMVTLSE